MVVAAEGARADAALTAGCSVSSSSLGVSIERPGRCAGTVVSSAAPADIPVRSPVPAAGPVPPHTVTAARASSSVVVAPVIKRVAPGVVPAAVIHYVSAMPIESPMTPAPSITAEEADSEADSEREVRAAIPDSGIRVPPRPRPYGTSVNQPRIICGDVNDIGVSRLQW